MSRTSPEKLTDLKAALGPNYDKDSIFPGPPLVFFIPISRHITPKIFAARRQLLVPYVDPTPPPVVVIM